MLIIWVLLSSGCLSQISPFSDKAEILPPARMAKHWGALSGKDKAPSSGPLTLELAIEEALAGSPELDQIRRRSAAAEEQVKQAEAAFYPRLILAEEYNTTDNPMYALMAVINQRRLQPSFNFNQPGQQQNFSSRIQGQWTVFEGGRRVYERKAALGRRDSLEAERLSARNALVGKVTETYYRWLSSLDFIDVAERALEVARTNEQMGESRLRGGISLPSELMRLKAARAEAHGNLVSAQTGARRFQAALERLIVRPIQHHEIPEKSPPVQFPSAEQLNTQELVEKAMKKRPEMSAVRALIQSARMRVRSAQGTLFPKLGTQALYQWDTEDFSDVPGSWMVSILATWPLFEGGARLSQIREARAGLEEMEAHGRQVALDIALDVHQAVLAVQESAEKIKVADEQRKYARMALKEVQDQYRNEVVTVDALLQAEVSWNRAETSYTTAIFGGKISQALLKQALGQFARWMETENE